MDFTCPICGKSGIADYKKQSIECPQCNSDLQGFMLIEKSKVLNRRKLFLRTLILSLVISGLSLALAYLLVYRPTDNSTNQPIALDEVTDSIRYYQNELKKAQNAFDVKNKETVAINYIVKPGDSFSKIAYYFYGDWSLYNMIQEANGISSNHIEPGDTLIINIK